MRAESVAGNDGLSDELRLLRCHPRIDVVAPSSSRSFTTSHGSRPDCSDRKSVC